MEHDIQATLSQMRETFVTGLPERVEQLKALLAELERKRPTAPSNHAK